MFENFFKDFLTAIDSDGDDMKLTVNGEELDLSAEENVKKAYDLVDAFADNPILRMFMTEREINKMADSAKEAIDAIHQSAVDETSDDADNLEDDAHYVANAYLEDTVNGWDDVPEDQKSRSINALANFFNWLKAQADND